MNFQTKNMREFLTPKDYITLFSQLPIGEIIGIPVSNLTPTQTDDGNPGLAQGAIDACYDTGRILIIHGHHRYYEMARRNHGDPKAQVRKIKNPYLDIRGGI